MPLDKMPLNKMPLDKMPLNKMPLEINDIGEMSLDNNLLWL
jgi:hypothetical protein